MSYALRNDDGKPTSSDCFAVHDELFAVLLCELCAPNSVNSVLIPIFSPKVSPRRAPRGSRRTQPQECNSPWDQRDNPRCRRSLCFFHRASAPTPPHCRPGRKVILPHRYPGRQNFRQVSTAAHSRKALKVLCEGASRRPNWARNPPNNRACSLLLFSHTSWRLRSRSEAAKLGPLFLIAKQRNPWLARR